MCSLKIELGNKMSHKVINLSHNISKKLITSEVELIFTYLKCGSFLGKFSPVFRQSNKMKCFIWHMYYCCSFLCGAFTCGLFIYYSGKMQFNALEHFMMIVTLSNWFLLDVSCFYDILFNKTLWNTLIDAISNTASLFSLPTDINKSLFRKHIVLCIMVNIVLISSITKIFLDYFSLATFGIVFYILLELNTLFFNGLIIHQCLYVLYKRYESMLTEAKTLSNDGNLTIQKLRFTKHGYQHKMDNLFKLTEVINKLFGYKIMVLLFCSFCTLVQVYHIFLLEDKEAAVSYVTYTSPVILYTFFMAVISNFVFCFNFFNFKASI